MFKKSSALLLAGLVICSISACGTSNETEESVSAVESSVEASSESAETEKSAETSEETETEVSSEDGMASKDGKKESGSNGPEFKQLRYEALKYYNGDGVDQDYEKAAELFEQASEAGDISAAYYLGLMYQEGTGVEQDIDEAVKWYTMAIEKLNEYIGNEQNSGPDELKEALCALAEISLEGGDTESAISYYESASELGWEEATEKLEELQ